MSLYKILACLCLMTPIVTSQQGANPDGRPSRPVDDPTVLLHTTSPSFLWYMGNPSQLLTPSTLFPPHENTAIYGESEGDSRINRTADTREGLNGTTAGDNREQEESRGDIGQSARGGLTPEQIEGRLRSLSQRIAEELEGDEEPVRGRSDVQRSGPRGQQETVARDGPRSREQSGNDQRRSKSGVRGGVVPEPDSNRGGGPRSEPTGRVSRNDNNNGNRNEPPRGNNSSGNNDNNSNNKNSRDSDNAGTDSDGTDVERSGVRDSEERSEAGFVPNPTEPVVIEEEYAGTGYTAEDRSYEATDDGETSYGEDYGQSYYASAELRRPSDAENGGESRLRRNAVDPETSEGVANATTGNGSLPEASTAAATSDSPASVDQLANNNSTSEPDLTTESFGNTDITTSAPEANNSAPSRGAASTDSKNATEEELERVNALRAAEIANCIALGVSGGLVNSSNTNTSSFIGNGHVISEGCECKCDCSRASRGRASGATDRGRGTNYSRRHEGSNRSKSDRRSSRRHDPHTTSGGHASLRSRTRVNGTHIQRTNTTSTEMSNRRRRRENNTKDTTVTPKKVLSRSQNTFQNEDTLGTASTMLSTADSRLVTSTHSPKFSPTASPAQRNPGIPAASASAAPEQRSPGTSKAPTAPAPKSQTTVAPKQGTTRTTNVPKSSTAAASRRETAGAPRLSTPPSPSQRTTKIHGSQPTASPKQGTTSNSRLRTTPVPRAKTTGSPKLTTPAKQRITDAPKAVTTHAPERKTTSSSKLETTVASKQTISTSRPSNTSFATQRTTGTSKSLTTTAPKQTTTSTPKPSTQSSAQQSTTRAVKSSTTRVPGSTTRATPRTSTTTAPPKSTSLSPEPTATQQSTTAGQKVTSAPRSTPATIDSAADASQDPAKVASSSGNRARRRRSVRTVLQKLLGDWLHRNHYLQEYSRTSSNGGDCEGNTVPTFAPYPYPLWGSKPGVRGGGGFGGYLKGLNVIQGLMEKTGTL